MIITCNDDLPPVLDDAMFLTKVNHWKSALLHGISCVLRPDIKSVCVGFSDS